MKDINLRQDAPSQVSQVNPTRISEEIEKLQAVQQEIINKENEIKELKDRENYIGGVIIPDLMNELRVAIDNNSKCILKVAKELKTMNTLYAKKH